MGGGRCGSGGAGGTGSGGGVDGDYVLFLAFGGPIALRDFECAAFVVCANVSVGPPCQQSNPTF